MSNVKGRSVAINQPVKLPGGTTLTRVEMQKILDQKGIRVSYSVPEGLNPRGLDCDSFCQDCAFKCTCNVNQPIEGLYTQEVSALIQAEVISLRDLNVEQLEAIRPTALETLKRVAGLEKQLSPEQLKAIKG